MPSVLSTYFKQRFHALVSGGQHCLGSQGKMLDPTVKQDDGEGFMQAKKCSWLTAGEERGEA